MYNYITISVEIFYNHTVIILNAIEITNIVLLDFLFVKIVTETNLINHH